MENLFSYCIFSGFINLRANVLLTLRHLLLTLNLIYFFQINSILFYLNTIICRFPSSDLGIQVIDKKLHACKVTMVHIQSRSKMYRKVFRQIPKEANSFRDRIVVVALRSFNHSFNIEF